MGSGMMKTGRVGNALFKVRWYQNRVEGPNKFGVTRNWFGKGRIVGVWGGGEAPNNLPKVMIDQSAHAPSPAKLRAGVEKLLDSYFEAANEFNNAQANFEKAKQNFIGTKFKKGKAFLIAAGISAAATAVFPFIGAIGLSLSTPPAVAFAIAAAEYFLGAIGIQYLIFRGGARKKALQEAVQKQDEKNKKHQAYASLESDIQKLFVNDAQREALAMVVNSLWTSGENAKQERCNHIYGLFTPEQQTSLEDLRKTYQTVAAAEKKIEEGEPLEEKLNQQLINRLDQVKRPAQRSGVVRPQQRIATKIEKETPQTEEVTQEVAMPSEEELMKIGNILNREYKEVTEEVLNQAQQDQFDLQEIKKGIAGLSENTTQKIDNKLSQLTTIIRKYRKELKLRILAGTHANYELLNGIGKGGFGIVYRARNTSNNENVAIKYMALSKLVEKSKTNAKGDIAKAKQDVMSYLWRFYTEYRLGTRLDHPHFCKALDTNIRKIEGVNIERLSDFFKLDNQQKELIQRENQTTDLEEKSRLTDQIKSIEYQKNLILESFDLNTVAKQRVFLATEFIPDKPGSDVAAPKLDTFFRGKMSLEDVNYYLLPVMGALAYAHEQGVYIRDIKPPNLLVTETENGYRVIIIDLGIAKDTAEGEADVTRIGDIPGSPLYMPFVSYYAEAKRERTKNKYVDIYAIGAVLYEKLGGNNPLRDLDEKELKIHLFSKPIDFDFSEIPEAVRPQIEKMLVRDPAQNYPSMEAARQTLAEAIAKAAKKTKRGDSGIEEIGASAIQELGTDIELEEGPAAEETKAGVPRAKATDGTVMARSTVLPQAGPKGIETEFLKGGKEEIEADLEAIFDGEAQIDYKDSNLRKAIAGRVTEIMMEHSDLSPLALDVLDMLSKYKD